MVLYALGSNGSGQLGIGHFEDVAVPTRHMVEFDCVADEPVSVCAGGNHTIILTASGDIYLSGTITEDETQRLGIRNRISSQTVLLADKARFCSTTWEATIIVGAFDKLLSIGKGEKGELGRGRHNGAQIRIPTPEISLESYIRISGIASGLQHSVVVLSNGQVWGWGNGRKGQLGEPSGIVSKPRELTDVHFKVVRAICGREFTVLLGDPRDGQVLILGSNKWQVKSNAPKALIGWKDIAACWGSVLVLMDTGKVLSWGRNDHGQLPPENLPSIRKIACGSEHCLALTTENQVLTWGWGEHGNCGSAIDEEGDVKHGWSELQVPDLSEDFQVVGIGAGCATSWIWTSRTGSV